MTYDPRMDGEELDAVDAAMYSWLVNRIFGRKRYPGPDWWRQRHEVFCFWWAFYCSLTS